MSVSIADLDDDCLRDTLKYVSLKDRKRFERVNRKWHEITDSLWLGQKVLSFDLSDDELDSCQCGWLMKWKTTVKKSSSIVSKRTR